MIIDVVPALSFISKQAEELGVYWNFVTRRLFGYSKWESVNGILHGLGPLNTAHLTVLINQSIKSINQVLFQAQRPIAHTEQNFGLIW